MARTEERKDLFGNVIKEDPLLRDKFIEPPFSVLDSKTGNWQGRKKKWTSIGIQSELGRDAKAFNNMEWVNANADRGTQLKTNTSIFDPALTELMYQWFCPEGGKILDPFAGGSVRGIVAHYLGYKYTGIELRPEQVESNINQGLDILNINNQPNWYTGDANEMLDGNWQDRFDMIFSCPPYANLEVYSKLPGDISNMNYKDFYRNYRSIIRKSLDLLKPGGLAAFVVSEVRGKDGNYLNFVGDTKAAFIEQGAKLYNDAVLLNSNLGAAGMRAEGNMKSKKLVRVHQNVLIFRKQ